MINKMIAKARTDKSVTKLKLSKLTKMNIGYLSHLEKGERTPSHKSLKTICDALEIPYQPLMYTYDKTLTIQQEKYNAINYISYNKIPAVSTIEDFIDCPKNMPTATIAFKVQDDSMEPKFIKDSYVFIEQNTPLNNKDYGVFKLNDEIIIRKIIIRKNKILLREENENSLERLIKSDDDFYIIGKILSK